MNLSTRYSSILLNPQPLPPRDLVIRWTPLYLLATRGIIVVGG